ncbi:MAG: ABC transporter substrate-binding protein [Anaerolineales bacterium]|nr:ABC transporter substrate-binding protein [Anaerolineales bacterium]
MYFCDVGKKRILRFSPLLLAVMLLAGCVGATTTPAPAVSPTATVPPAEVTRIVTREIVVTATPAPPGPCAPASLRQADQVNIGVLAPLATSSVLAKGLALQAGVSLALEELQAAGGIDGKPVEAVVYDTGAQPARAAQLAERLITRDCVIGIVGGVQDDVAEAIKQVTERYGVPFIVVEATADSLTEDRPRSLFRIAPAATMASRMQTDWLTSVGDFNRDGVITALMIAENTAAGDAAVANVERWMPAAGINLDTLRVDVPAADYSPQIARIVAMEKVPDAAFLFVGGNASLELQRQLLDAGIGPTKGTLLVQGRSALDGPTFWQRLPDGAFTVVGRRGPWQSSLSEIGQAFLERYRTALGQLPESIAFTSHDAVLLLVDAAKRADSLAPADIVSALEAADTPLAGGRYRFPYGTQQPASNQAFPAYLWHQWPDPPLLYLQYREANQDPATIDVIWPLVYRTILDPILRP